MFNVWHSQLTWRTHFPAKVILIVAPEGDSKKAQLRLYRNDDAYINIDHGRFPLPILNGHNEPRHVLRIEATHSIICCMMVRDITVTEGNILTCRSVIPPYILGKIKEIVLLLALYCDGTVSISPQNPNMHASHRPSAMPLKKCSCPNFVAPSLKAIMPASTHTALS
jgi:hypothetical protein